MRLDLEKTSGTVEIGYNGIVDNSKIDEFSITIRKRFEEDNKIIYGLFVNNVEVNKERNVIIFHFDAECYEYNFHEHKRFWKHYVNVILKTPHHD